MEKQLRTLANHLAHGRAASEIVADAIRPLIATGNLKPGERLSPERELAPMLGVARVTLRAAIRTLNEQGLLATTRGRCGSTVVAARRAPRELAKAFKAAIAEFYEFRQAV